MVFRHLWQGVATWRVMWIVVLSSLLPACSGLGRPSTPTGRSASPSTPAQRPKDGSSGAEELVDELFKARAEARLPSAPRDPTLDEKARTGLAVILAGLPEGVTAIDHILDKPKLSEGLTYGVVFEEETPGLSEAERHQGRRGGYTISNELRGSDPALDGIGWAARGPWAVIVFRSRHLVPLDAPALQKALEAALARDRPGLQNDPALSGLAAAVVADGVVTYEERAGLGRAGGVPVTLSYTETASRLPSSFLNARLADEGPGSLHEPWLRWVGAAATVTETGVVTYVVLATGEAERPRLVGELDAAAPQAADLVNRHRTELGLPKLRLDPVLAGAARKALADATDRQCFAIDDNCPAQFPKAADYFYGEKHLWYSPEAPFTWRLERQEGDEQYRRFGAAATIGPDGLVWTVLLLAA